MGQKVINNGTIWGGIKQKIMFWDNSKKIYNYNPDIYIDKNIEDIAFNDVLYVINDFPDDIKNIIQPIAITINSNIKPSDILDIHNKDIFIPQNSGQVEKSKKLWEGWLLFLVYLQLHCSKIDEKDYKINTQSVQTKLKILYADSENSFSNILHHLKCTDTFKSRRITHYIFTNQSGKLQPNLFTKKQIDNIIPDISNPETIIDQKVGKNNFGCFHIEELNQNISSLTQQNNLNDLIKEKIIEVLENALN